MNASTLPPVNIGRMSNKGFEIELGWDDAIGRDFHYHIGGNLSYAVNKIEYMAEPSYEYEWMNTTGFALFVHLFGVVLRIGVGLTGDLIIVVCFAAGSTANRAGACLGASRTGPFVPGGRYITILSRSAS